MEIQVTRSVVVEAMTIEDALDKTKPKEGITVSVNAAPRPQQGQTMARTVSPSPMMPSAVGVMANPTK